MIHALYLDQNGLAISLPLLGVALALIAYSIREARKDNRKP